MTMNPWRLRLLCELDTYGTVRAVAQAANLSASSVSQQLAVLEAETHTQLLERVGRRARITPTGVILARRARAILDHVEAGMSIALLPSLAVDRRHARPSTRFSTRYVICRELS